MSIKTKVTLLTSIWLIGILVVVNCIVYVSFIHIATNNERELLINKAESLLQKFSAADLLEGDLSDSLAYFLPDNGLLRIVNRDGVVVQSARSDDGSISVDSEYVRSMETELYRQGDEQILVARLPIQEDDGLVLGTLEMAEQLEVLEGNINILISILVVSTICAIGVSLLSGVMLSKLIVRPISNMVRTMEEIEQSLVFHKIPLTDGGKDELYMMAATFNRMMDRIEQSFLRQHQFVSDASHELKTPITVIEGYAKMLQRWGLKDEKVGQEAVNSIYGEAVRMKAIAQQLLDLAKLENEFEMVKTEVELVSMCEEVAGMLRKLFHREIRIIPSDNRLTIKGNRVQIKQLLMIILDNAIKYSQKRIDLILTSATFGDTTIPGVEIRIKDYGIGIPRDELTRVFERFYRVDQARHRKTGGTGLGLSIARAIVHRHDGAIRIESEEHEGTEVIVFLPSQ
ncbi:HAMP domain-containing histidine kinase [Paenibacillus hodogayensis]|uniref:Signal transduction histidine-protein kinase ArlS n=1 Tax=Paenibacillus hodogayensis TaxID=279208 RepID=A0ABV5W889_9BACL